MTITLLIPHAVRRQLDSLRSGLLGEAIDDVLNALDGAQTDETECPFVIEVGTSKRVATLSFNKMGEWLVLNGVSIRPVVKD